MKAVVLGSGQDGGVPQLLGPDRDERSASSVAVVTDDGAILLDCAPDVRRQHRALTSAIGDDAARIAAVALTHGHMGHYAGLVHFGKEAAATTEIPLYGTRSMIRFLESNEPWATLFRNRNLVVGSTTFEIGGVKGEAIPVPHRSELTDAVAWSISDDETRLLYLPDIDSWDAWPNAADVIGSHDVALLDASFFDEDEPLGRPISEIPHPLVVDTLERFRAADCRVVLTHLNHTNALARGDADAHARVAAAGWEVAFDGMVIE
ncbi:MAG: MBL fold metallo-hydrolase [Acidimicrobiia bacterium]|nr:MBL fold metallo-hydrolase [Acidimicrobiia bacterium]